MLLQQDGRMGRSSCYKMLHKVLRYRLRLQRHLPTNSLHSASTDRTMRQAASPPSANNG